MLVKDMEYVKISKGVKSFVLFFSLLWGVVDFGGEGVSDCIFV